MRSIGLSQLRNTRQLVAWLRAGETIELRDRKRVIARIVPNASFIERPEVDTAKAKENSESGR
jgi:antitoxin (DNA-binding transcriptional repressor) of toxin-antitoxin stability system